MNYVLFDGQHHQSLKPLTLTRPVAELRVGIYTIREKWTKYLDTDIKVRCKDYLAEKFNSFDDVADVGICGALLPDIEIVPQL